MYRVEDDDARKLSMSPGRIRLLDQLNELERTKIMEANFIAEEMCSKIRFLSQVCENSPPRKPCT